MFDPLDPPADAWPEGRDMERRYIDGIASGGVESMVANVRTRWRVLRMGDRIFPLTIDDGDIGDSYVCQPHSAYVLYAREELEIVDTGALRPLLSMAIRPFDALLRAARINRIVHLDNWLLSTNLHGDWRGENLASIRAHLTATYPDHLIAIRSIDTWSAPELASALNADGWVLLPSRQIWVVDDLSRDWRPRTSVRNDFKALCRSGLHVDTPTMLSADDATRIADLYRQLYIDKYSSLNPRFTPDYIRMTHAAGAVRYRVARAGDGRILAVGGIFVRDGVATAPIVGYDTSCARSLGLYRIASLLARGLAMEAGLRFNGSAGAADFKRARGARAVAESMAVYTAHLPVFRRAAVNTLASVLRGIVFPMMVRRQL
ncbi:MAG: GNAT family N-acetyltransferase [Lysobacter sp.]|nr:GNAT family N-acetyltransferase [Lysobacter sp.]